jgi:hypothetical protein
MLGDLDLDLTTPATANTHSTPAASEQKPAFPPILIKRFGEVAYSIYFDKSTASSLNTKIYKGDQQKLILTTYKDIYNGQMPKRASFEVCSWCGIFSINDNNRVVIKDKPNSIQSEMIYKNTTWFLVKGSGNHKETNYDTNLEDASFCYMYPKENTIHTKNGNLEIETEVVLTDKVKLWIMAMLFMTGYETK